MIGWFCFASNSCFISKRVFKVSVLTSSPLKIDFGRLFGAFTSFFWIYYKDSELKGFKRIRKAIISVAIAAKVFANPIETSVSETPENLNPSGRPQISLPSKRSTTSITGGDRIEVKILNLCYTLKRKILIFLLQNTPINR